MQAQQPLQSCPRRASTPVCFAQLRKTKKSLTVARSRRHQPTHLSYATGVLRCVSTARVASAVSPLTRGAKQHPVAQRHTCVTEPIDRAATAGLTVSMIRSRRACIPVCFAQVQNCKESLTVSRSRSHITNQLVKHEERTMVCLNWACSVFSCIAAPGATQHSRPRKSGARQGRVRVLRLQAQQCSESCRLRARIPVFVAQPQKTKNVSL